MKNVSEQCAVLPSFPMVEAKTLHLLHICRRFGPVGGMERYVWELVRELAAQGHHIEILCEVDLSPEPVSGLSVYALGESKPKPRWLAHFRFSERVKAWINAHPNPQRIIHSHERSNVHHVTTFHGPPFALVRELSLWRRLSWRVKKNLELEKRELCSPNVQTIIPNSALIRQQLSQCYPDIKHKLAPPIVPGVVPCQARPMRTLSQSEGNIGFIGQEWKRKGLQKAIDIMRFLSKTRTDLCLFIAGVEQQDIQHLLKDVSFKVQCLGRVDANTYYKKLDVLLHPAIKEPYGMVITEALSACVPVVVSDACGAAADIMVEQGAVVAWDAPLQTWADAVEQQLNRQRLIPPYQRSWGDVASEHDQYYQMIEKGMP